MPLFSNRPSWLSSATGSRRSRSSPPSSGSRDDPLSVQRDEVTEALCTQSTLAGRVIPYEKLTKEALERVVERMVAEEGEEPGEGPAEGDYQGRLLPPGLSDCGSEPLYSEVPGLEAAQFVRDGTGRYSLLVRAVRVLKLRGSASRSAEAKEMERTKQENLVYSRENLRLNFENLNLQAKLDAYRNASAPVGAPSPSFETVGAPSGAMFDAPDNSGSSTPRSPPPFSPTSSSAGDPESPPKRSRRKAFQATSRVEALGSRSHNEQIEDLKRQIEGRDLSMKNLRQYFALQEEQLRALRAALPRRSKMRDAESQAPESPSPAANEELTGEEGTDN